MMVGKKTVDSGEDEICRGNMERRGISQASFS
jgi:hypothetical protein